MTTTDEHEGRPEHVPGEWRDLPRGEAGYIKPHTVTRKPTGIDWAALAPTCTRCGEKSSQVAEGLCPTCRGITPATDPKTTTRVNARGTTHATTYAELDEDDLVDRFTAPTQTPAAAALTSPGPAAAAGKTTTPASERGGGDRPAAAHRAGKAPRQPATTDARPAPPAAPPHADRHPSDQRPEPATPQVTPGDQEATVTSPPFPTYIVDIAVLMRDSEGHHDPAVRAARKAVANALVGLNRALTKAGSPAASTSPDEHLGSPRPARASVLAPHHVDLIRDYIAGTTPRALGRRYGVSDVTVRTYLTKHGVRLRDRSAAAKNTATNQSGATA